MRPPAGRDFSRNCAAINRRSCHIDNQLRALGEGGYQSDSYQQAIPFRKKAADWRVVLVEGIG